MRRKIFFYLRMVSWFKIFSSQIYPFKCVDSQRAGTMKIKNYYQWIICMTNFYGEIFSVSVFYCWVEGKITKSLWWFLVGFLLGRWKIIEVFVLFINGSINLGFWSKILSLIWNYFQIHLKIVRLCLYSYSTCSRNFYRPESDNTFSRTTDCIYRTMIYTRGKNFHTKTH